jgi:hypothetical protein
VTARDLPPLSVVEEWLDVRDITVRVSVEAYERWIAAAERDGYGPHGDQLGHWLRDLGDRRAAQK